MVRNLVRLLTVREVAEVLRVCKATAYARVERGELERVWVGTSIRVPAESLEALLASAFDELLERPDGGRDSERTLPPTRSPGRD